MCWKKPDIVQNSNVRIYNNNNNNNNFPGEFYFFPGEKFWIFKGGLGVTKVPPVPQSPLFTIKR